jgi:aconitate hydratase
VLPSLAGPKRPQDRVLLEDMKSNFHANVEGLIANRKLATTARAAFDEGGGSRRPSTWPPAASPRSASTARSTSSATARW